jgi:hypothetical protein
MEEFTIPTKLINTCKTYVQKTRTVIKIGTATSSFFKNKTGLKQGDTPSQTLFNLALQKVIQSTHIVPSGIMIGKEQLIKSAYADDIVLIGKYETEIRQPFVGMENTATNLGLQINHE